MVSQLTGFTTYRIKDKFLYFLILFCVHIYIMYNDGVEPPVYKEKN